MDIALRKDLIEIQDIIANPPPETKRHSRYHEGSRHKSAIEKVPIQQLSQLELRYSKLDLGSGVNSHALGVTPGSRNSRLQLRASSCDKDAPSSHRYSHAHLPTDDAHRIVSQGRSGEARGFGRELAVDVPDWVGSKQQQQQQRTRARTRRFQTLAGFPDSAQVALPDARPDPTARRATQPIRLEQQNGTTDVIPEPQRPETHKRAGSKLGGSSRISRRSAHSLTSRHRRLLPVKSPLRARKLSLVQLRSLVRRRQRRRVELTTIDTSEAKDQESSATLAPPSDAIKGRRFERLQRDKSDGIRALNGSRLVVTRPLASLTDQNQLYAIPKKSSKVSRLDG